MANGTQTPLISPGVLAGLRSSFGARPKSLLERPSTGEVAAGSLARHSGELVDRLIKVKEQKAREEQAYKEQRFVSSSALGFSEVARKAEKTLSEFYRSDGQDVAPPPDFSKDLGLGISLTGQDFMDEKTGRRRGYSQVLERVYDRYTEARRGKAPSLPSWGRASDYLREAKSKALIRSESFEVARTGVRYANDLNAIVVAHKQAISSQKGFNPDLFATALESARSLSETVPFLDRGKAAMAFRIAAEDLVAVEVEESVVGKDNDSALRVLGSGPLANTESVRLSMLGLPWKDKQLLSKYRKQYQGQPKYTANSRLPNDRTEYFSWALGQLDKNQMSDLQNRAIKSFHLQTQRVRGELNKRIQGATSASSYIGVKSEGFRESVKQSLRKAAVDINRVYPRDIYPDTNAGYRAQIIAAEKMLDLRNVYDSKPLFEMLSPQASADAANKAYADVVKELPKGSLAGLPVRDKIFSALETMRKTEIGLRQKDPGLSIRRADKQIAKLDTRLKLGDYANQEDKVLDQETLYKAVQMKAGQLNVAPVFLSSAEEGRLKQVVNTGNLADAYSLMNQYRNTYGGKIYGAYIRPQVAALEGGEELSVLATLNRPEVAERVLGGILYTRTAAKGAKSGDSALGSDQRESWRNELRDFNKHTEEAGYMTAIRDYYTDIFGESAKTAQVISQVESIIPQVASHMRVEEGLNADAAIIRATKLFASGLGEVQTLEEESSFWEFGRDRFRIIPQELGGRYTGAEVEDMQEMFYDTRFLQTTVIPNLKLDIPRFKNTISDTLIFDSPETNAKDILKDRDVTKWLMLPRGAVPTQVDPLHGYRVPFPSKAGGEFMLRWEDIDVLLEGAKP